MANIDLARPAPTPSPSSSAIYNDSASSVTATASNKSLLDSSAFASSVLDWDVDRVCKWISELGLSKYTSNFKESNITGNVLISLNQAHLQEIGVASVGHRLRILKSVYNITEAQEIDAGPDRYIPPTVICFHEEEKHARSVHKHKSSNSNSSNSDMDALPHILKLLEIRDERLSVLETEIKRLFDNYSKLREELLPLFRLVKESKPLPMPVEGHLNSPSYLSHHQSSLSPPLSASNNSAAPSPTVYQHQQSSKQQHIPSFPGPPVPTLGPTPQALHKGIARRKSTSVQQQQQQQLQQQQQQQNLNTNLNNNIESSSHLSPIQPSSANSQDWLDTSFYGSSPQQQQHPQQTTISSGTPINNLVTTTIITPGILPSTLGTGRNTPTTAASSNTAYDINDYYEQNENSNNDNSNEAGSKQLAHTGNNSAIHLSYSSNSASTPVSASSSKKFQMGQPPAVAAAQAAAQYYSASTVPTSSSASPSPSGQPTLSKPPLSHSNSLPHPGSHDEYLYDTHDPRGGLAPRTSYLSLATSSVGRSNTLMSVPTSSNPGSNASPASQTPRPGSNNLGYVQSPHSAHPQQQHGALGMAAPHSGSSSGNSSNGGGYGAYNAHGGVGTNHSHGNTPLGTPNLGQQHEMLEGEGSSGYISTPSIPATPAPSSGGSSGTGNTSNGGGSSNGGGGNSASNLIASHRAAGGSEPIKDFNIPPDVPCYKVLPVIAKKHKVRSDKVELVVCYDDQERMIGLEELPLKIFKELDAKGKNPIFMIRESTGVKTNEGFVVSGTPGGLF